MKDPKLCVDGFTKEDVEMGLLALWYFLAVVAGLTKYENFIQDLFITKESNKEGIYTLRLFYNGELIRVVVDDYFPCIFNKDGKLEPIFAKNNGSELWVLLLEKAFAKLSGGYEALNEGYLSHSLTNLTSAPVIQERINKNEDDGSISEYTVQRIFDVLKSAYNNDYLLWASTPSDNTEVNIFITLYLKFLFRSERKDLYPHHMLSQ